MFTSSRTKFLVATEVKDHSHHHCIGCSANSTNQNPVSSDPKLSKVIDDQFCSALSAVTLILIFHVIQKDTKIFRTY